jgi:hypothetical protein
MIYKVVVDDAVVEGLEFKRDVYNQEQGTTLTTEEFVSVTLTDWARHAQTGKRKKIAADLIAAFAVASPQEQAQMLEVASGFLNKP